MKQKKQKNDGIRLYNLMFPIWMMILFPTIFWIFLPINFIVDSVVLAAALAVFHYEQKGKVWVRSILRVWVFGYLADVVGALLILGIFYILDGVLCVSVPLWRAPYEQLMTLPGIALAGVLIYFLNRRFSFRKTALDPEQIRRLSLALAIFTAPYTMLISTSFIYS